MWYNIILSSSLIQQRISLREIARKRTRWVTDVSELQNIYLIVCRLGKRAFIYKTFISIKQKYDYHLFLMIDCAWLYCWARGSCRRNLSLKSYIIRYCWNLRKFCIRLILYDFSHCYKMIRFQQLSLYNLNLKC